MTNETQMENSNGLFVTDQEELEQISWNELRKVSQ